MSRRNEDRIASFEERKIFYDVENFNIRISPTIMNFEPVKNKFETPEELKHFVLVWITKKLSRNKKRYNKLLYEYFYNLTFYGYVNFYNEYINPEKSIEEDCEYDEDGILYVNSDNQYYSGY